MTASSSCSTNATSSSQPRYIDNGNLELISIIGTGAYGVVYLAIDLHPSLLQPTYRAVKCLRRSGLDSRQRHFQRREIALHGLASSHPSIITMDRIVEEGDQVYVVMDYGEEGDLFAMITDRQRHVGDDELIRSVFLQLLDGIAFLHGLGIAHRDVKPENIVCSNGGTRVRLCDFGLATSESISSEFGCGSTFYIAPECLGDWSASPSYPTRPGDIWSLGVILVNLVCGRNPWRIASPTDESFNAYLNDAQFLRRILPISEECLYILSHIFTVDPTQRIDLLTLRTLVMEVKSFSMDEEELRRVHLAAQAQAHGIVNATVPTFDKVEVAGAVTEEEEQGEEWVEETVFIYDDPIYTKEVYVEADGDIDGETPSLRADSGSPSPSSLISSYQRSRSTSSNGPSLPPTPLLGVDVVSPSISGSQLCELFKAQQGHGQGSTLKIRTALGSPDVLSALAPNPFFR